MFAWFLDFGARARPQDLWAEISDMIRPSNLASPVNRAHVKRP